MIHKTFTSFPSCLEKNLVRKKLQQQRHSASNEAPCRHIFHRPGTAYINSIETEDSTSCRSKPVMTLLSVANKQAKNVWIILDSPETQLKTRIMVVVLRASMDIPQKYSSAVAILMTVIYCFFIIVNRFLIVRRLRCGRTTASLRISCHSTFWLSANLERIVFVASIRASFCFGERIKS